MPGIEPELYSTAQKSGNVSHCTSKVTALAKGK